MKTTTRSFIILAIALAAGACHDFFDVPQTNQPTLDDLINNPTRDKLAAAANGIFAGASGDIQSLIWRAGSMGREGINLSGNNTPDYSEPYFGPLSGSGFGAAIWGGRYANIRSINIYLQALAKTKELSAGEIEASRGMAQTFKALALLYVIETRGQLGAPVDVDRPVTAPPAPFVSEDSVYGYIIGILDSAQTNLSDAHTAVASFPFSIPVGLASFGDPQSFIQFNRALAAKAEVFRATAQNGCNGTPANCWNKAETALAASFYAPGDSTQFKAGAYFDFSTDPGDATNDLSDPLNGTTFYALPDFLVDADTQVGGLARDLRAVSKIVPAQDTQILGGVPINGQLKFTVYFTNGAVDLNHSIPIIRDEELVLLDAEARIGLNDLAGANAALNLVRQGSGNLHPDTLTGGSPKAEYVAELLYNRRYSLMWEQGTRWIDARRYGLLANVPTDIPNGNVPPGAVPPVMPIPDAECNARGLGSGCAP
ncbi:MAG TPA: RagB/SusD family nutrient uptake outer membrane protein [Gemmatimonadales bacterium]|nr:RagB/SusD family nutrient uptake outer membrane protein [Gemmatimonadales bacterium]